MDNTWLLSSLGSVIFLLLAGNLFFIKKLIDKIEQTGTKASDAFRGMESQGQTLMEIKSEIKELRRLEIDVAVMKSALQLKIGRARPESDLRNIVDSF